MPQDDRMIHGGVRTAGKGSLADKDFVRGKVIDDPDELEKAAADKESGIDLQALHDAGVISGTWKGVKAHAEGKAETKTEAKK